MTSLSNCEFGQFVGGTLEPKRTADDPVCAPMIRHWCQSLGDTNPVYTDVEYAKTSIHKGLVAHPAMLQAWTLHDRRVPKELFAPDEGLFAALDRAGYAGSVGTNCEHTYLRYLRPGDVVTSSVRVENVSEKKETRLGPGYFVGLRATYRDENTAIIGRMRFTILRYRPRRVESGKNHDEMCKRILPTAQEPVASWYRSFAEGSPTGPTRKHDAALIGEEVAPLELLLTRSSIVSVALASRDFYGAHHDVAEAKALGAPEIFLNTIGTMGFTCRFITDWAGPEALIRKISLRLGISAYAGDSLTFTGRVLSRRHRSARSEVKVELTAATQHGHHATGTVSFALPIK